MKWFIGIVVLVVALIVGLSIYLQPNSFIGCSDTPSSNGNCDKADAIVVVSGGDTEARTVAGISLYQNGWAEYLVLSGAAFDKSGPSNAAAMKRQAVDAGIPESAILIDEDAMNTQQNAENTQSILEQNKFDNVILVTSGYHQRRASLEFNKGASDDVVIRNYPVLNDDDWGWYWWVTPRGWWLAGGEVAKIIAFYFGVSS